MSNKRHKGQSLIRQTKHQMPQKILPTSILDKMEDGKEFQSLLSHQFQTVNLFEEFKKSIGEFEAIRKKPLVCYIANVVNPTNIPVSIDNGDDLPFDEMINSIPAEVKEIDIAIVTPGGSAHQVAKFVNLLRPRFDKVSFIVLNRAMSAGTIFVMSGDEIIMGPQSHIGPIDPQVRNRSGEFVPAQSILTLIEDIRVRGEENLKKGVNPYWTDLQILKSIDPKDIGNASNHSQYSIQLVEEYLFNYKFKTWVRDSKAQVVTDERKKKRSKEIATLLCDHSKWRHHGHAITREAAWDVCKLKIMKSEDIQGLNRAMRRMWALSFWSFENLKIAKIFVSKNYCIFRQDNTQNKPSNNGKST